MPNKVFKDRQSLNPNRRKLKIISQTPNEIIADIERADTVYGEAGDAINADVLNAWSNSVDAAESNAGYCI